MTANDKLADEIERILAEYHRAVELDDTSLLPKILSQWCDLFFKPGASAILSALRAKQEYEYNCQAEGKPCDRWCGANPCLAEREPATEAVRDALENLVSLLLETMEPIGPMRDRKDYPPELQTAINALKVKAASPEHPAAGEIVMVPREQLAELLSMVPVGIWGPSGKKLLANVRAMLAAAEAEEE